MSKKYPIKTGRLVKEIIKNVKSSVILTSPSCLIPIYDNEECSLGKHSDKFGGIPEYVINVYLGDERLLYVESSDNKFSTKILCKQGMIRIFHPLFNIMFMHEKKKSSIKRKIHYALSIRQADIRKTTRW